ncbi:MAG: hypothetical protein ACREQI_05880 [Candidatus Binataceae bacterium]
MNAVKIARGILFAAAICALLIAAPMRARAADAQKNLLENGDFSLGGGAYPEGGWHSEAWINNPQTFQTNRIAPTKENNFYQVEVDNLKPDDGRWMEPLTLKPGWYEISADARAEDVGANKSGVSVSVFPEGIIMSPELKGTTGWQRLKLYIEVTKEPADISVALRVGGFGSLNTGKGFFRNAAVYKIPGPPPSATPTYDLTKIRKEVNSHTPLGSPITLVITFAVLGAMAVWGWRMYGEQDIPPDAPASAVSGQSRAERRAAERSQRKTRT